MTDSLNRIGKHQKYWESTITPTPEVLELAKLKLTTLALEAMEEAGQLKMEFDP